jgi:hypothetical protein
MIHSYPKIYNIGHRAIKDIFNEEVTITEKIDGSQFSFGVYCGQLVCKSKNNILVNDAPDKMFIQAVETVKEIQDLLVDGWTYRGEYLKSPNHNAITYDRTPKKHIMLYDVDRGDQDYLSYEMVNEVALKLGLEIVPLIHRGKIGSAEEMKILLERKSILGDVQIEGVVAKNYMRFNPQDGKALMCKYVSENFKEINNKNWKTKNLTGKDFVQKLADIYRNQNRWAKAVQHLKESNRLNHDPSDISLLIREVHTDVHEECADEIKEKLFKWAWKHIGRKITAGLPEWYKEKLLVDQFSGREDADDS